MFGVIFVAVLIMIITISKFKVHPFIAMVVIAIGVGLVCGIDPLKVINIVKSGLGNILANIGIVILCGTITGTILEKTVQRSPWLTPFSTLLERYAAS